MNTVLLTVICEFSSCIVIIAGSVWADLSMSEIDASGRAITMQRLPGLFLWDSDQFSGRLGLIFASIGAAIGTETFRFPRMVGANGGGTFLILGSSSCLSGPFHWLSQNLLWGSVRDGTVRYIPNLQERNLHGWDCGLNLDFNCDEFIMLLLGWCEVLFGTQVD